MTIFELIEKTIGNRRAVQIFLRIPFLPKRLFLGAKFRYFNRYELDQEAANYIRALVSRPRISLALNLNKIMFSFGPLLENDNETLENIRILRQILLDWKPRTARQCYSKIRTLIECFEFSRARKALQDYGYLLQSPQHKELCKYFELTEDLMTYFAPLTDQAWENTLSYRADLAKESSKSLIIFYLPPSLLRPEISSGPLSTYFLQICEFIMHFHQSIPRSHYIVAEKLQFSWRNIREHEGNHEIVSYHTKGNSRGNIRIKESAFPAYLTVDSSGFSGWHSVANLSKSTINDFLESVSDNEIEGTYQTMYRELVESNSSKYKQTQREANPTSTRGDFFFLALQVTNDIVAELAYIDTYKLLKYSSEIAERNQINLVIKRHPRCTSIKIKELLESLRDSNYVEITDASIHAVLPKCKAIITVNSGVGMEALLHLKSIISTGRSEYSYIASIAKTQSELERQMLDFSPTEPSMIKEFLHYYTCEHLFHFDDIPKIDRYWERRIRSVH